MSEIAIHVENVGKLYRIGELQKYKALRDTLSDALYAPFRAAASLLNGRNGHEPTASSRSSNNHFWALKEVSFEVKKGEVVGIIGRNGAGKSTLLKILSRITKPTEGYVRIHGRVGSLLEVGTGFHPELTGRENIYLNGAIIGMRKKEIDRKFDEIVAFAEVEKFIDTSVKLYSSGMYVRLAFAVAAHMEPEIMLVDEVLAVGDAAFQKKCLGKMSDVAKQGRTVLLVSHNMGVLREIVGRAVWLDEGRTLYDGDITEAISRYLSSGQMSNDMVVDLSNHPRRRPGMKTILKHTVCKTSSGIPSKDFSQSDEVILELDYAAFDGVKLSGAGFILTTMEGIRVGGFNTYMAYQPPYKLPQVGKVTFIIPARQLTPGSYFVTVSLGSHQGILEDKVENAISFTIQSSDIYGTGYLLTKEDGVAALSVKVCVDPLTI